MIALDPLYREFNSTGSLYKRFKSVSDPLYKELRSVYFHWILRCCVIGFIKGIGIYFCHSGGGGGDPV